MLTQSHDLCFCCLQFYVYAVLILCSRSMLRVMASCARCRGRNAPSTESLWESLVCIVNWKMRDFGEERVRTRSVFIMVKTVYSRDAIGEWNMASREFLLKIHGNPKNLKYASHGDGRNFCANTSRKLKLILGTSCSAQLAIPTGRSIIGPLARANKFEQAVQITRNSVQTPSACIWDQ